MVIDRVCCAVDCGIVINPDAASNLAEGAIVDGIGNALYGEMTFTNGVPDKNNFGQYRMIRCKHDFFLAQKNESMAGIPGLFQTVWWLLRSGTTTCVDGYPIADSKEFEIRSIGSRSRSTSDTM